MSLSVHHPTTVQQPVTTAPLKAKPAEEEMSFLDHLKIAGTIILIALGIVAVTLFVFWLAL